jgi:hypothetical protein
MEIFLQNEINRFRSEKDRMVNELNLLNKSQFLMRRQFSKVVSQNTIEPTELRKYQLYRQNFETTVKCLKLCSEYRNDFASTKKKKQVLMKKKILLPAKTCPEYQEENKQKLELGLDAIHEKYRHILDLVNASNKLVSDFEERNKNPTNKVSLDNRTATRQCETVTKEEKEKEQEDKDEEEEEEEEDKDFYKVYTRTKKSVRFNLELNTVRTYELEQDEIMFKRNNV